MAEILISLTIIGIIAAITLPVLRANINESAWATQRKALYSRMSQAIAMMPALNGYGIVMNNDGTINENATADNAAQAFVSEGLSKVLKINNICSVPSGANAATVRNELKKCGISNKISTPANSKIDFPPRDLDTLNTLFVLNVPDKNFSYSQTNTKPAAFETQNGESIVVFYNPTCTYGLYNTGLSNAQLTNLIQPTMCVNFIYDLNGKKGPNKVNKDIGFITAFYATDSVVAAPVPVKPFYITDTSQYGKFHEYCRNNVGNDTKAANIEDLMAIFVNNQLINDVIGGMNLQNFTFYSTNKNGNGYKVLSMWSGALCNFNTFYNYFTIYCVRR